MVQGRYRPTPGRVIVEARHPDTGYVSQDELKRPPRVGTIANRGEFKHLKEGSTVVFDNTRATGIADGLWSIYMEAIQRMVQPSHGLVWQLELVQPESGDPWEFKPTNIDTKHRSDRNDDRPLSAIVKSVPTMGFSTYSAKGMEACDIRSGKITRRLATDGRMPVPGDTVWLGWLGWRCSVDEAAHAWPEEITCVIPADGSEPWCMEGTCLVMLVASEVIDKSGLFVSGSASTVMHRGVVVVAGDGCGVSAGDSIIFRAIGLQNPTCPSPFGDDLPYSHVRASSIVAIDTYGPTIDDAREAAKLSQEALAMMYANGGIASLGHDNDWHVHRNRTQELELNLENRDHNRVSYEGTGGITWA